MTAMTASPIPPATAADSFAPLRACLVQTGLECSRLLRTPAFAVLIVLFPLTCSALLGFLGAGAHAGPEASRYGLATFVAFGAVAPGLLPLERALRVTPRAYLVARMIGSMLFAALVSVALMLLAAIVGKVVVELVRWVSLFILAVLGVTPVSGAGLMAGTLLS